MKYINLTSAGCGVSDIDMGDAGVYTFTTRFNYTAACWSLDIADANGLDLLAGLMLVPGVDLLRPYPVVGEKIGALYLIEDKTDAYKLSDSLGNTTHLTWYSPAEIGGNG